MRFWLILVSCCLSLTVGCRIAGQHQQLLQHESAEAHISMETQPEAQTAEVAATIQADAQLKPNPNLVEPAAAIVTLAPEIADPASEKSDNTEPNIETSTTASKANENTPDTRDAIPIDLPTALMLVAGQNPQIDYAKAKLEEARARLDQAEALKLPSIRAGINYNKHEGRIQDVAGEVIETSRGSFYSGLGASAVGASSPAVPGIVSEFHIADAIYQPRIAQQTIAASRAGTLAITNDQLLATAIAYIDLLQAEQELAVANSNLKRLEELVATTTEFARVGQGLESDRVRAQTEYALRSSEAIRLEENAAVASIRLSQLMRWDSTQRLVPQEERLIPIDVTDQNSSPQELVAIALTNRPEIAEMRHLVGEAIEKLRREKNAPLIPSVLLAASYGGLGGGLGSDLGNYGDRLDADAMAYWELRQFGAGERAIRREANSKILQARMQQIATMDKIAAEVNEAKTRTSLRQKQLAITTQAIENAESSYIKNWDRIRNGQGLPIEVLQAIQALSDSQREHVKVIADYNRSQFTLIHNLGWPVTAPNTAEAE